MRAITPAEPKSLVPRFHWRTQTSERIAPRDMQTSHLFNSLRMVFNHTAPAKYTLVPFKRYRGIERWSPLYRRTAVIELLEELSKRNNRTPEMELAVAHMAWAVQKCYGIFTPELLN